MKRLFDVAVSATSLVLLALPFVFIALLVKFSSQGPVFYRQRRVGQGGQPFRLYKFRTMRMAPGGAQITVEGDPRVTPVGKILRRFKLDELPQFWNILRGDMSVIGPRPEVERFVVHYTHEQRRLLDQTPGLAGLSQLVYPDEAEFLREFPDPEQAYLVHLMPRKIAIDLQYESSRTFWSDLQLVSEIALLSTLGKSRRTKHSLRLSSSEETRLKVEGNRTAS